MTEWDDGYFNPFPGLRPFNRDESDLFFGRDRQSDELLARLRRNRFLAVVGSSGSGKSSLVKAGLLPGLFGGFMVERGSVWRVAEMRPGGHPIGNLAEALNAPDVFGSEEEEEDELMPAGMFTETTLRRGPLGLADVVRQGDLEPDENLLVVVDQFEEIFRFKKAAAGETEDDSTAFIRLLLNATDPERCDLPIYVIVTMRSDHLGDCAQFRNLPERINDGQYLIPRLTPDQIREAIVGPAAVGGATVSHRLVQRLLGEVGDDPDQLPILQHALMRTWDVWRERTGGGEAPIDLEHYLATGGMDRALNKHANEIFDHELSSDGRRIAKVIFQALTEKDRATRRPRRFEDLCAVAEAEPDEVTAVIEAFRDTGRSFLMPPKGEPLRPRTTVDISHESLMRVWKRLREWVDEEGEEAQRYSRLVQTAALHEQDPAAVGTLTEPALGKTLEWWSASGHNEAWGRRYDPEPEGVWAQRYPSGWKLAEAFLEKSRRARWRRKGTVFAGLGLLLLLSLAVFGLYQGLQFALERAERFRQLAAEVESQKGELERQKGELEVANTRLSGALDEAEKQRGIAEEERGIAEDQRRIAEAQRRIAEEQRQLAQARRMATVALSRAADELDLSLLVGVEASATDDSQTRGSLLEVLQSTPRLERFLGRTDAPLRGLSLAADGRTLAALDADGAVGLWDLESGRPAGSLDPGQPGEPGRLAFSPDGSRLALADDAGTFRLLRAADRRPLGPPVKAHEKGIRDLAFSPDGSRLATAGGDGLMRLWDGVTGEPLGGAIRAGRSVQTLAFSPDGRILAAGDARDRRLRGGQPERARIRLWDVETRQVVRELEHSGGVRALAFAPGREVLISAGRGGRIRLWNPGDGEPLGRGSFRSGRGTIYSLAVSPDGRLLAAGGSDRVVRLWALPALLADDGGDEEAEDGPRRELEGHPGSIRGLAFSADGALLASAGSLGSLYLWRPGSSEPGRLVGSHRGGVNGVGFAPDGALVTAAADGALRSWRVEDEAGEPSTLLARSGRVGAAVLSPDGTRLATAGERVLLWETASGLPTRDLGAELGGDVLAVAVSPDGKLLASGSTDGRIRLWSSESRRLLGELEGHRGQVTALAFRPGLRADGGDGASTAAAVVLASGGEDRSVRLWDPHSRQQTGTLEGHRFALESLAFSPDGAILASGDARGRVRLWDVAEMAVLEDGLRTFGAVNGLAFSPDGERLACGSRGVQVWRRTGAGDASGGRPVRWRSVGRRRPGGTIYDVAFSPSGDVVAAATRRGVELWSPSRVRPIGRLSGGPMHAVGYVLDGEALAAGGRDGSIHFWSARTRRAIGRAERPAELRDLAYHEESGLLAAGGLGGAVGMWRLEALRHQDVAGIGPQVEPPSAKGPQVEPPSAKGAPPASAVQVAQRAAAVASGDRGLAAVAARRLELLQAGHPERPTRLAWSRDGRRLVTAGRGPALLLWDLESRRPPRALLYGESGVVAASAFRADGRTPGGEAAPAALLASGGPGGGLRLWDLAGRRASRVVLGPGLPPAEVVAVSPDRSTLALGRGDGSVLFWDVKAARPLGERVVAHRDRVTGLAFAPEGLLASADDLGRVALWDVAHREVFGWLADRRRPVSGLAFSGDGGLLAVASRGAIELWSSEEGPPLLLPPERQEGGEESEDRAESEGAASEGGERSRSQDSGKAPEITALAFCPPGPSPLGSEAGRTGGLELSPPGCLVTGDARGGVRIWDLEAPEKPTEPGSHDGAVTAVAVSRDGSRFATGGADGAVRMWTLPEGREEPAEPLEGHADAVVSVVFSVDGRRLGSTSADGELRVWSAESGQLRAAVSADRADGLGGLAFSRDGSYLAAGDDRGEIHLWNGETGERLGTLRGHPGGVRELAFSRDGERLAASDARGGIHLWGVADGERLGEPLAGPPEGITGLDFSPDGAVVAAATEGGIHLWEVETGQRLGEPLEGHAGRVAGIRYLDEGGRLVSAGEDRTLRLWRTTARAAMGEVVAGELEGTERVALARDGSRVATSDGAGEVRRWELDSPRRRELLLSAKGGALRVLAFSPNPDDDLLAAGDEEGTLRLWSLERGRPVGRPLIGHEAAVVSAEFSPDGSILASGDASGTVRFWDARRYRAIRPGALEGHEGEISRLEFSSSGNLVASTDRTGEVSLWRVDRRRASNLIADEPERLRSLAVSPDGAYLASGSYEGEIRLWRAAGESWELVASAQAHARSIYALAFSPDGRSLASAGADGRLGMWDGESLEQLREVDLDSGALYSAAFSPPDGALLAVGSRGGLRLFDSATLEEVSSLSGGGESVLGVAFSPNGRLLAAGYRDGGVTLWNTSSGRSVGLETPEEAPDEPSGEPGSRRRPGQRGWIRSVAFSPDGRFLAAGGRDGRVRLWRDVAGRRPRPLDSPGGHPEPIRSVAFSPDGRTLATAGDDGVVRLWDLAGGESGQLELGPEAEIRGLGFLPSGWVLAAAATDGRVHRLDLRGTGALAPIEPEPPPEMKSVAFDAERKRVALGATDGSVWFYDGDSGEGGPATPAGHSAAVVRLVFSPEGEYLASADDDETLRLWDTARREPVGDALEGHDGRIVALGFDPDGRRLASIDRDRQLRLWGVPDGGELLSKNLSRDDGGALRHVRFSRDGRTLLEGDDDDAALWRIWDEGGLEAPVKTLDSREFSGGLRELALRRRALISRDVRQGALRVWDWDAKQGRLGPRLGAQSGRLIAAAQSRDGTRLATATDRGALRVWDTEGEWRPLQDLVVAEINSLAFGPGELFAAAGSDGSLLLWSGKERRLLAGHPLREDVTSLAFDRDGARLASGDATGRVILWDAASGDRVASKAGAHAGEITGLAFDPGGALLASGDSTGVVRLWDAATGEPAGEALAGHDRKITALAFGREAAEQEEGSCRLESGPGRLILASGGADATVVLWDVESGLPAGDPLTGHASQVERLAFGPDCGILVSGDAAGGLRLWDVARRKPLGSPLRGHDGEIRDLVFSGEGSWVTSAAWDGVRRWDIDLESWRRRACCKANRNLTLAEWNEHVGEERYRRTCDWLPPGEGGEAFDPLPLDAETPEQACGER